MRVISIPSNEDVRPEVLAPAIAVLNEGGLLIVPTDTVYGLAADPRIENAEEKLRLAKNRPGEKHIALLAASIEQAVEAGAIFDEISLRLAQRHWPGPLTIVLRAGQQETGIRVPAHPVALALIKENKAPLLATSANISGMPPALTAPEACAALAGKADLCIDAGPAPLRTPSSVIKVVNNGIVVLRQGAVSIRELEETAEVRANIKSGGTANE